MTETINKYSNGKIYKIISFSNPDVVYYGSTVNSLNKRMSQHRAPSNKCISKQIIDFGDAVILLVENYPCENKEQLNRKEGEYILNNDCINKVVAGRTLKEYSHKYYIDNKEENKIAQKEYYELNKEKQIARQSVKYDCICGNTLTIGKKARHNKSQHHLKHLEI